jgi:hypothetical protein
MKQEKKKLTLGQPVAYRIDVQGYLDKSWSNWNEALTMSVRSEGDIPPVTTITAALDQAALQGLLRRLYALGLPLISVHCREVGRDSE